MKIAHKIICLTIPVAALVGCNLAPPVVTPPTNNAVVCNTPDCGDHPNIVIVD